MARIRTIKPEISKHELLFELEQELGCAVRFAWAVLPCHCDREGRFKWRPLPLKTDIMPYDNVDFSRVLDAWVTRGMLVRYRVGHAWYGWIPTFKTHQFVNSRETASALPSMQEADEVIDHRNQEDSHASTTREPPVTDASATLGHVYVATADGTGAFKVGFSLLDPALRVNDLSCGSPVELKLLTSMKGPRSLETELHHALAAFHQRREWFTDSTESRRVLDAWMTRAPRVPHAPYGDGKGRERLMGRERITPSAHLTAPTNGQPTDWLLDFKLAYPSRAGDQGWRKAVRAAHARLAEGHSASEFIEGAKRYAAFVRAAGKERTEFVKQAATFLGPDKPFLEPWDTPPTKSELRQDKNLQVSEDWLQEQERNDAAH